MRHDSAANEKAKKSSTRAEQSSRDANEFNARHDKKESKFEPTPELKSLYRELAKLLHPDLTLDPNEKERRHKIMQQINEAYQNGDRERLLEIAESERNNPDNVKGDDVGSSLVRTIRKIAQIEKRISELESQLEQLRKSDLNILFETVQKDLKKGVDLLKR